MSNAAPAYARQAWSLLEPLHAVTYFANEPLTALKTAGYRGFWMSYFAARTAPLGPVHPEIVHALFYNFTFDRIAQALPSAWEYAPPAAALAAREQGAAAALRRQFGELADSPELVTAADLACRVAAAAPLEGRALFAANRALPEPTDPVARLWYAATLLREHRGDGHIAALVAAGVSGRESHVLQALTTGIDRGIYTVARDYDDQEWAASLETLRRRGWVTGDVLSDAGQTVKTQIEDRTDAAAASAYTALEPGEQAELLRVLRPLVRAVIATGEMPGITPIGVDLTEVAAPD